MDEAEFQKQALRTYISQYRILTTSDVLSFVGMSRSTLDRWIKKGLFPPPAIKQGKTNLWLIGDIHSWLEQRTNEGG